MPAGCTALDYAFQIHTFLGTHCIGAKVNHKLVPLSHKLQGGDQVEIITSNSQHVQPVWINFVTTAKARNKIQALLRKQEREYAKEGNTILISWLEQNGLSLTTSILNKLAEVHKEKQQERLLVAIAKREIVLGENDLNAIYSNKRQKSNKKNRLEWRKYIPFVKSKNTAKNKDHDYLVIGKDFDKNQTIVITEDNISRYKFPDCCKPIPGDPILAYINGDNELEIHSRSCTEAARLKSSFGTNILAAQWNMRGDMSFVTAISMKGIDRKGMVKDVTIMLSDTFEVNIHRLTVVTDDGIFIGEIELKVRDNSNLDEIIKKLQTINGMQSVHRV